VNDEAPTPSFGQLEFTEHLFEQEFLQGRPGGARLHLGSLASVTILMCQAHDTD
jgi:hypothetical protein